MKQNTNYVLCEYQASPNHEVGLSMFSKSDFRVPGKQTKIDGYFVNDATAKGLQNGMEKGFFYSTNGVKYIVFVDHSTIPLHFLITSSN